MSYQSATPNYDLPQWQETDAFQMTDFNTAFSSIDSKTQPKITATGVLKGDGAGGISAAAAADIIALVRDTMYPVGRILFSANNVNPGTYLGGTWTAWGSGRVPVGVNTAQSAFNTAEKTGGEINHTLTVAELPSHSHPIPQHYASGSLHGWVQRIEELDYTMSETGDTGSDQPHNNLQPYITCYMWKRTA